MDEKIYREFAVICRENGWKCTSQRVSVYALVYENYSHPGVDEIWTLIKKTLPAVTRESVYRILNEFAESGLIQRLDHLSSARYDCQVAPHGHFVCEKCGAIADFALPPDTNLPVNMVSGNVRHIELRLSGVCAPCAQAKPKQ